MAVVVSGDSSRVQKEYGELTRTRRQTPHVARVGGGVDAAPARLGQPQDLHAVVLLVGGEEEDLAEDPRSGRVLLDERENVRTPGALAPALRELGDEFVSEGSEDECAEWSANWDRDTGVVRSMTGELWDLRQRRVFVATARTQAVIGFAGGDRTEFAGARVELTTPFYSEDLDAGCDRGSAAARRRARSAPRRHSRAGAGHRR
jgi:hypothetical protein